MALNLEQDFVGIFILGSDEGIKEGGQVKRTEKIVSVPVGNELSGELSTLLVCRSTERGLYLQKKADRLRVLHSELLQGNPLTDHCKPV